MLMPLTVKSVANARIAPMAMNARLAPMPMAHRLLPGRPGVVVSVVLPGEWEICLRRPDTVLMLDPVLDRRPALHRTGPVQDHHRSPGCAAPDGSVGRFRGVGVSMSAPSEA